MILKASRRAGSKQLADHLMNVEQNEHVFVGEVRGFMTNNLNEALQEIYVQARANPKVKKFLFSVSINPPVGKVATAKDMIGAADQIEKTLGLAGQPRVIVFHEKQGRRHAHLVVNLMDENLKIIKLPFYKKRLNELSHQLFLKHGWELPKGFRNKQARDPASYDLSEWQAAQRNKLDPKALKARLQHCWNTSKDLESVKQALSKEGFALAKGDIRGFVLVDMDGKVRSLPRALSIKTKDARAKLGDSEALQSVEQASLAIADTHKANTLRLQAELTKRHEAQLVPLKTQVFEMTVAHRRGREELAQHHIKRQQFERNTRQAQHKNGLRRVWQFVTGQFHQLKKRHETEYNENLDRDAQEKEALIQTQLKARETLQQPLDALKKQHQAQMLHLSYGAKQSKHELGIRGELSSQFEHSQPSHQKSPSFIQRPELDI